MNEKRFIKKTSVFFVSTSLICGLSMNIFAKSPENYLDLDYIVGSDVNSLVPKTLGIIYPRQAEKTSLDTVCISGTSDPDEPLYVNDQEIVDRDSNGIFEVVLSLPQDGKYECIFKQGDNEIVVPVFKNIEPTGSYDFAWKEPVLQNKFLVDSQLFPTQNKIIKEKTLKLECVAPAGASVVAEICGATFNLKQEKATKEAGVSAKYSLDVDLSSSLEDEKTYDLGNIVYKVNYNGEMTEKVSVGKIYYSNKMPSFARVSCGYGLLRSQPSLGDASEIVSILKKGVVDRVIKEENDFYQLGCGRWIGKKFVEPIFENIDLNNKITEVGFSRTDKYEILSLKGSLAPVFTSGVTDDKLIINLSLTDGNLDLSSLSGQSELFEEIKAENKTGYLELTFNLQEKDILWGYSVDFKEDTTLIYLKKRPKLSQNSLKPLENITVLVDAGHGGSDTGALGIIGTIGGGTEKDINLANALAVRNRLISLGANVVMTRDQDTYVSLSDRAELIEKAKPDLVIVLHADATQSMKAEGVTVYYTNDNRFSKSFSSLVADTISKYTERQNRKEKYMDFYVSKNTFSPTAFIETGFLTNLTEASKLFTREQIFDLANAIGDSIIKYLSK